MDLAFLSTQKLLIFLLVLTRTAGIFALTPIFGGSQVPMHVKVGISVGMALVFLPIVGTAVEVPIDFLPLGSMILREACVGLVIGFVCSMIFAAIQSAGELVDMQSGFSFAATIDPINGAQTAVAARFYHLVAALLFFVTNAHHVLIRGVADSFRIAPLGQMAMNPAVTGGVMDLFYGLFMVAVRIAVPVLAAVFLADLALAVISRVVPQMNVLIVGMPLKLGVGIVGMLVALPVVSGMSQNLFGDVYTYSMGLLRLLVGG
jgi:flagellar biosynthesis protein FliR